MNGVFPENTTMVCRLPIWRAAWSGYPDHVVKRSGEQQRRERDEAASGASISSMNSDETEVAECKTGSKSHNRGEIPDPTAATSKNMEEKQIKSVGPGEHIKFVTLVKDLQLRGTPVGSVQWDEQLRIPVFCQLTDNVTLHGLFFCALKVDLWIPGVIL